MCLSGAANGAGTAANGTMGTAPTPGIAAAVTAAANALSGGGAAAFSSILRLLNLLPATVRDGAAGVRPLGGPGGSRAAPGVPGLVSWWVGGVPGAVALPAKVAGSRDAVPLALFARRSISSMPEGVNNVFTPTTGASRNVLHLVSLSS